MEAVYPILYLDALVIKLRDGQAVRNFACYLAIGVNLEGDRDVLGIWFQKTDGANNWSSALIAFRIHFGDRIPDTAIGLSQLTLPENLLP